MTQHVCHYHLSIFDPRDLIQGLRGRAQIDQSRSVSQLEGAKFPSSLLTTFSVEYDLGMIITSMPMLKPLFSKFLGSGSSQRPSLRQTFHKMSASGAISGSLYVGESQNERDMIPLHDKYMATELRMTHRQNLEAEYHT